MEEITSRRNPIVARFRDSTHSASATDSTVLLEGPRLIDEALAAGVRIDLAAISTGTATARRSAAVLDRLDRTVAKVLDAARAEEHGRNPIRERVDLAELLGSCIEEMRARYRLSKEAVELKVERMTPVRGDSSELELIFNNLLENAIKYSDEPVQVRVRVETLREDRVRVEIADSGIGIPPRELRKIFRRFYRAGRDMQRTAAGLGLGLFVVRSLVRKQGGRVVALSEGAGRGSRFVVTLRTVPL